MKRKIAVSGSTLKLIAVTAMLIDHIGAVILYRVLVDLTHNSAGLMTLKLVNRYDMIYGIYTVMRAIGRFGFPLFCFLLVEGFVHTRSICRYAGNLFLFAILSEIPFDLALKGEFFSPEYQNVYFTLLIGLLVMEGIRRMESFHRKGMGGILLYGLSGIISGGMAVYLFYDSCLKDYLPVERFSKEYYLQTGVISVIVLFVFAVVGIRINKDKLSAFAGKLLVIWAGVILAEVLSTDYAGWGVLTISVMYLLRKTKVRAFGAGILVLTAMSTIEAMAFWMLPPVERYNGKRGLKLKYVFYLFYPVHLLLLELLAVSLGY